MQTRQIFNGIFSETRSLQDLSQDKNICSKQYYWLILNGSTVKNLVEELKISLRQAYFLTKNYGVSP